jgi:hypothetical protein
MEVAYRHLGAEGAHLPALLEQPAARRARRWTRGDRCRRSPELGLRWRSSRFSFGNGQPAAVATIGDLNTHGLGEPTIAAD